MEDPQKLQILRDVFDIDWTGADEPVDSPLARFTRAVVTDDKALFYDDDEFISTIRNEFPDDHALWDFITLD